MENISAGATLGMAARIRSHPQACCRLQQEPLGSCFLRTKKKGWEAMQMDICGRTDAVLLSRWDPEAWIACCQKIPPGWSGTTQGCNFIHQNQLAFHLVSRSNNNAGVTTYLFQQGIPKALKKIISLFWRWECPAAEQRSVESKDVISRLDRTTFPFMQTISRWCRKSLSAAHG